MKQSEIKLCAACGKGVGHSNQLTFYCVQSKYMMLDIGAIRRADGMEQMMGGGQAGAMLQQVMGRNEDLAVEVSKNSFCVCLQCAVHHSLAALMEMVNEKEAKEKAEVDAARIDQPFE